MVGSIDPRCETVRGTHWPKAGRRLCLELASRKTILASGKTQPHQQAGHMDASDPIKPEKTLVAWGPSTYGSRRHGAPPNNKPPPFSVILTPGQISRWESCPLFMRVSCILQGNGR